MVSRPTRVLSAKGIRTLLSAPQPLRRLGPLSLVGLGWLLSPLCWWNDLVFNLPLALGFAKLVQIANPAWFVPGLAVGYWLSNVIGIVLMQSGALSLLQEQSKPDQGRNLMVGLLTSSLYTIAVLVFVKLGWFEAPLALLDSLSTGQNA